MNVLVDEPEDEDAYDVKNLMNKFKNIEKEPVKLTTHERPTDLEGIKVGQIRSWLINSLINVWF